MRSATEHPVQAPPRRRRSRSPCAGPEPGRVRCRPRAAPGRTRGAGRRPTVNPCISLEVVAEEGDPAVTEVEQVLGRLPTDLDVVDQDAGHALDRGADGDHRHPQVAQRHDRRVGQRHVQGQQPVDPLGQRPGVDPAGPPAAVHADGIEQQVVALLGEHFLGALDHGGEEPAGDPRRDDADRVGAPGGQGRGRRRREVARAGWPLPRPPAGWSRTPRADPGVPATPWRARTRTAPRLRRCRPVRTCGPDMMRYLPIPGHRLSP